MDKRFVFTNQLKFFEIEEKGKKRFFVKGAFSSDDLDLVNDICTKNCLESMVEQMKSGRIKMDFEHEAFRGKDNEEKEINKTRQVLAKAVGAEMNGTFAEATWELNDNYKKLDEQGNIVLDFKTIKQDVERGFYDAFSIAYIPTKIGHKNINGERVRLLDDVRLLNVALTGNPVNTAAQVRGVFMKSMDAIEEYKQEKKNDPELSDQLEVKAMTRTQQRNQAISEEEDEEDEEETKKYGKKKIKKKAYEKDGAHAHTEAEPLGIHNHPELEKEIGMLWEFVLRPTDEIVGKSHSQENLQSNEKEVKMTEEENNAATEEAETIEAPAKVEEAKPEEAVESNEVLNEVKSLIANGFKSVESRLDKLESKDDEEAEAPDKEAKSKVLGAENSDSQNLKAEGKTVVGGLSALC